jgi:hypothetical protein
MARKKEINIEIDKLTRSIENAISGDRLITRVVLITKKNIARLKKKEWLFDWKKESQDTSKAVYKLVIDGNENILQGLISLQDRGDHIFMNLIESNQFNKGTGKLYLGVPGNLIAFACKLSFEKGYDGFISFESKTKLILHYQKTLGATVLYKNIMVINNASAKILINKYFDNK